MVLIGSLLAAARPLAPVYATPLTLSVVFASVCISTAPTGFVRTSKNARVFIVKLLADVVTNTPRARIGFVCAGTVLAVIIGRTVNFAGVTARLSTEEALRSKLKSMGVETPCLITSGFG